VIVVVKTLYTWCPQLEDATEYWNGAVSQGDRKIFRCATAKNMAIS